MKIYFRCVLLTYVLSATALAQPLVLKPSTGLQQFLGLSDDQVRAIQQNNDSYSQWSSQQQDQIQQLRAEIANETSQPTLDPMALGVRYAGIETICRSIAAKSVSLPQQNLAVLTDPQKSKMSVLTQALALSPTIAEAQAWNLLGFPSGIPSAFTSIVTGLPSQWFGISNNAPGCQATNPIRGIFDPQPTIAKPHDSGAPATETTGSVVVSVCGGNAAVCFPNNPWFDTTRFIPFPAK